MPTEYSTYTDFLFIVLGIAALGLLANAAVEYFWRSAMRNFWDDPDL